MVRGQLAPSGGDCWCLRERHGLAGGPCPTPPLSLRNVALPGQAAGLELGRRLRERSTGRAGFACRPTQTNGRADRVAAAGSCSRLWGPQGTPGEGEWETAALRPFTPLLLLFSLEHEGWWRYDGSPACCTLTASLRPCSLCVSGVVSPGFCADARRSSLPFKLKLASYLVLAHQAPALVVGATLPAQEGRGLRFIRLPEVRHSSLLHSGSVVASGSLTTSVLEAKNAER